jgi:hypothetical protein
MEMRLARMLRAACALAALLSLSSCSVLTYIFGSVFPATAMLAKAQADLSSKISADDANSFSVKVVEAGGYGYVVVTGNPPSGAVAYFYDLDLNQKATFSAATGLASSGVMADASGNIALGQYILNPANLSIILNGNSDTVSPPTGNNGPGPCGNDGFVGASTNYYRFSMNSYTLSWATYGAGVPWSGAGIAGPFALSSNTSANLQLFAILDDGNPSGNAYFVVGPSANDDTGKVFFFSAAKTGLTIPTNIADASPSRDNIEVKTIGFANGSIFAYDAGAASFVKINPSDGSIQSSFYSATDEKKVRFAYRANGGSFYGFDTETRVLRKYGAWWQE